MDVTAPRPSHPAHDPAVAAGQRPDRLPLPEMVRPRASERPPASGGEPAFRAPSTLKFSLTAADVDARFEIHEATSTVTVTMYDRTTGEVLREVPSREVLDVVAALAATGLRVDEVG
jgi:flagellar protein FlaG